MDSQIQSNSHTLSLFPGNSPTDKQSFLPVHSRDQKNPYTHWKLGHQGPQECEKEAWYRVPVTPPKPSIPRSSGNGPLSQSQQDIQPSQEVRDSSQCPDSSNSTTRELREGGWWKTGHDKHLKR